MKSNFDCAIETELRAELDLVHQQIARLCLREARLTAALKSLQLAADPVKQPRPGWPILRLRSNRDPLH